MRKVGMALLLLCGLDELLLRAYFVHNFASKSMESKGVGAGIWGTA